MSDLRTRIIAALLSEDDVALMADAVIAELKNDPSIMFMTHVCEEGCTCD